MFMALLSQIDKQNQIINMDIALKKKRFTTGKILAIAGILAVVALIIFVLLSSTGASKLNVDKERLSINAATTDIFQENIPVNGVVLPITTIYLDALEGGRVEEKFVEDGAIMKKGEPIMRLSNTDLELSLVNQETSVYNLLTQMQISQNQARQNTINRINQNTDVENSLIESKRVYDLNKRLYDKGVIAKQEFIQSENDYNYQKQRMQLSNQVLEQDSLAVGIENNQATSSYARTQNALELMRRKVADLVVRAPVDGQLTSLDAEIGQSINKGMRLGQIDVLSGFKVRADIDEHYISRIYTGQTGTFTLNNEDYGLEIKKVFTQVTNGRFQVDMQFSKELPEDIRRGQTLQVKLALSQEKEALLIPKGGFFQDTGGSWIFKVSQDGTTAYKTSIKLGSQNTKYYEVLEGLEPGDRVLTNSYSTYGDVEELVLKD
jgi:HlyD family secretion protein